jgi:hypothetical protein
MPDFKMINIKAKFSFSHRNMKPIFQGEVHKFAARGATGRIQAAFSTISTNQVEEM